MATTPKRHCKILIATPTMGGSVKNLYVSTVLETVADLRSQGIETRHVFYDGAEVFFARNFLSSVFMEDTSCTHLFFVDSDMHFSGSLCGRMIAMGKPIIGAAYTMRNLNLGALWQHRERGIALEDAVALASVYAVFVEPGELRITAGACQVKGMGFGAVLIERGALERMVELGAARIKRNDSLTRSLGLKHGLYSFFDPMIMPDGDYRGEDFSFCERWRAGCGGELWTIVDADVRHIGDMQYGQPYIRKLKQGVR